MMQVAVSNEVRKFFKDKLQRPPFAFTISLTIGQHGGKKTGNNTALQGQEVQSLDISGTCFHPYSLYSSFYLLFQKRGSKPRDGWAERCKVSKSEQSLTAALPEEQKQKSPLYL